MKLLITIALIVLSANTQNVHSYLSLFAPTVDSPQCIEDITQTYQDAQNLVQLIQSGQILSNFTEVVVF